MWHKWILWCKEIRKDLKLELRLVRPGEIANYRTQILPNLAVSCSEKYYTNLIFGSLANN